MTKVLIFILLSVQFVLEICGNINIAIDDKYITTDYTTIAGLLEKEWASVQSEIGDTYDGYEKNKQALLDWYALVQSETTALYDRTSEKVIAYYKLVADTVEHEDDAIEDATDDLYDVVYARG